MEIFRGWSRKLEGEVPKVTCQRRIAKFSVNHYLLVCVICFVSFHVVLQLSVFYHHDEENIANYAVWHFFSGIFSLNMLIILCLPCLSDWFASHHTLWMVRLRKSESAQRINIFMDTAHLTGGGVGVASHPIQPLLDQPPDISCQLVTTNRIRKILV